MCVVIISGWQAVKQIALARSVTWIASNTTTSLIVYCSIELPVLLFCIYVGTCTICYLGAGEHTLWEARCNRC